VVVPAAAVMYTWCQAVSLLVAYTANCVVGFDAGFPFSVFEMVIEVLETEENMTSPGTAAAVYVLLAVEVAFLLS